MKNIFKITDKEILNGCLKNDRKYQQILYERFACKMLGVCRGYTKNTDAAEDMLQEGFVKVFQNIVRFNNTGPLEGWIRRIMVNNAIDNYRRNREKHNYSELTDYHCNTHSWLIGKDAYTTLAKEDFLRITHNMPDGYRLVLNLYFAEDRSHKEIAEQLGITEGTSKSQLSKAKSYLRKNIDHILEQELIEIYRRKKTEDEKPTIRYRELV